MKRVLIAILLITPFLIKGQPYQPLLGNTNYWYLTSCVGTACLTDFYYANDDTLVNGKTYKVLDSFHYNRTMLIREDTALRQVYCVTTVGYSANLELMLYDFSMSVGQVQTLYNPNSPAPNEPGDYIVDSIVNVQIQTGTTRAFYLSELGGGGSKQTIWLEGVGALTMISTPSEYPNLQAIGDLSCFYRDGTQVYESDSLANGPCDTTRMITSTDVLNRFNDRISMYPNPTYNNLKIELDFSAILQIYNAQGRLILINDVRAGSNSIDLSNLPPGLLFVQLYNRDNVVIYSRKIIHQ